MNWLDDLRERWRELTAPVARAPDPGDPHPTPEEWATWAEANLSPEDAARYRARAQEVERDD